MIVGAIVTSRVIGDRLPDWMFGLFLTRPAGRGRPRRDRVWELHDIGRDATAALAAGMTLLIVVTVRGSSEILDRGRACSESGCAVAIFLDTPPSAQITGRLDRAADHRGRRWPCFPP